MSLRQGLAAPTTHRRDYITPYVDDLRQVVDVDAIRASGLRLGVDPMGGAAVAYWAPIAAAARAWRSRWSTTWSIRRSAS